MSRGQVRTKLAGKQRIPTNAPALLGAKGGCNRHYVQAEITKLLSQLPETRAHDNDS
jgi:hypothetical protein